MATPPQASKNIFAGWKGTEERPEYCDNQHVLEGFNVDFVDGTIRRRGGTQRLMSGAVIRPTLAWKTSTNTDFLNLVADGGLATFFVWDGTTITVGCPHRFLGVRLTLSSVNSLANAATATVTPLDNTFSPAAFAVTDTTLVGGVPLKQNGTITWNASGASYNQWSADRVKFAIGTFNLGLPEVFGVTISYSAAINASISELSLLLTPTSGLTLLSSPLGMSEFVTRAGERKIVAVFAYPGLLDDATAGEIADTKILAYNLQSNDCSSVGFGQSNERIASPVAGHVSMVSMGGWMIGSSASGTLWKYDGATSSALEALPGADLSNGVIGAQGYLPSAPRGVFLETYHSKLMVAGSPDAPLTFYASLPDNDLVNIPPGATVGGANVWPINGVYTVPGSANTPGDYITGASVVNDRYVIFTRAQSWVFDETSLRLVNGNVGCVAPGSIQRIDQSIFFLSDLGVFVHDGSNSVMISQPLARTMRRVNWRAVQSMACSAHHVDKGEYWLWLPINGEWQNQIAIVYNYITKAWRIVGSWYPFDTNARRDSLSQNLVVGAACNVLGSNGKRALVSIDKTGNLWQHDVGHDDNGFVYPAYAVLHELSSYSQWLAQAASDSGEDYVSFRHWFVNVVMDGSWLECVALADGERFDQELDRRLANVATNSEIVQKQALIQNGVNANRTSPLFSAAPAWPVATQFAQARKLKFSFGKNLTKMRPVLHWPGGQYVAGSYANSQVAAPGAVYDLQIVDKIRPVGR